MDEIVSQLLGSSIPTYYNYKKQNRLIIKLLERLGKDNLIEFLENGKIEKLDEIDLYFENLNSKCKNVYRKIELIDVKRWEIRCIDESIFDSNYYFLFIKPFVNKFKEEFTSDYKNYKYSFFELAMQNHFELRNNGVKEPYTTFKILSILDELNNYEFYYFFTKFDVLE